MNHVELKAMKARALALGFTPLDGAGDRAFIRRNGDRLELRSYDTLVFSYNVATDELARHWLGYSVTTLRHVERFVCWLEGRPYRRNSTFGKANWEAMPVTA